MGGVGRVGRLPGAWPVGVGLLVLAIVLVRCAWMCDDAYISFRTVDNIARGLGPRWNVDDRVQAFTSPLWVALCVAVHAATREIYFSVTALSVVLATGAAALLAVLARDRAGALLGLAALALSKPWVDYAVCGLENPLAYVLLAAFLLVLCAEDTGAPRGLAVLGVLVSGLLLTRHDLSLLVFPAVAARLGWPPRLAAARPLALGLLAFAAWEGFALFYYGVPFPNTAYAKLGTGVPLAALAWQGSLYLADAARLSPLTVLAIAGGTVTALARREMRPLGVGLVLHLLYVLRIGGDFMSGRFLTAPFVVAVAVLLRQGLPQRRSTRLAAVVAVVLLGAGWPRSPLWSGAEYGRADPARPESWHGIADERAVYYQETGLLPALSRPGRPIAHRWAAEGMAARARGVTFVRRIGIGFYAFHAGPGIHVLDVPALADPLLARLPAAVANGFRIGHFLRPSPEGYEQTLRTGENHIVDPDLAAYWDVLSLVTRGPLTDRARLRAIVDLNLGRYDHLRRAYVERTGRSRRAGNTPPW